MTTAVVGKKDELEEGEERREEKKEKKKKEVKKLSIPNKVFNHHCGGAVVGIPQVVVDCVVVCRLERFRKLGLRKHVRFGVGSNDRRSRWPPCNTLGHVCLVDEAASAAFLDGFNALVDPVGSHIWIGQIIAPNDAPIGRKGHDVTACTIL